MEVDGWKVSRLEGWEKVIEVGRSTFQPSNFLTYYFRFAGDLFDPEIVVVIAQAEGGAAVLHQVEDGQEVEDHHDIDGGSGITSLNDIRPRCPKASLAIPTGRLHIRF